MNQSKLDVEFVSDGRDSTQLSGGPMRIRRYTPFRPSGVGTNDHSIFPVGNALLDVTQHQRLAPEIVHGDVEEALNLTGVEIHCDDVITTRDDEHICNELCSDGSAALVLFVVASIWE